MFVVLRRKLLFFFLYCIPAEPHSPPSSTFGDVWNVATISQHSACVKEEPACEMRKAYLPGRGDTMIRKVVCPGRGSAIALRLC